MSRVHCVPLSKVTLVSLANGASNVAASGVHSPSSVSATNER
jgi:hypothetical protein